MIDHDLAVVQYLRGVLPDCWDEAAGDLHKESLALRRELHGAEATARADGRRLTVRRGPYRILANFGDDAWPLDGEPLLVAGDVRDRALAPLAGAVVR